MMVASAIRKRLLAVACQGHKRDYVSAHAASPAHWQKIEDLEEENQALKAELGR